MTGAGVNCAFHGHVSSTDGPGGSRLPSVADATVGALIIV